MRHLILVTAVIFCKDVASQATVYPTVQTKVGTIRGLAATDGDYDKYLGIPYAKVNLKNPFGLHLPQPPFVDVFDAFKEAVTCVQKDNPNIAMDCLQMNIYVPRNASMNNTLPVLMFIHGGGFDNGWSSDCGPKFLVRHDVILVNIHYRLGPYGFMCLDIPEVPGNQGLRDALEAIKWVKENIDAFGGDPDKITIMGHSAGGFMVDYLLRFSEPNLFDKAIMISGAYSHYRSPDLPNYQIAIKMAKELGFNTTDSVEAIEFLTTVEPLKVLSSFSLEEDGMGPCIEKQFPSVPGLVTEDPDKIKMPNVKTTPILLGYSDAEFGDMKPLYSTLYTEVLFEEMIDDYLAITDDKQDISTILRRFYMGDEPDFESDDSRQFGYFVDDLCIVHSLERAIRKYLENGASEVYRFMFSYIGGRYSSELPVTEIEGAGHISVPNYLFDFDYFDPNITAEDQLVIDRLTKMWTNFVKYGNPTPETSELLPINWPQVGPKASYYLNFGTELKVEKRPFGERMAFLDLTYMFTKNSNI